MKKQISFLVVVAIVALVYGFSSGDKNPTERDGTKNTNITSNSIKVEKGAPQTMIESNLSESFENVTFPPAGWTKINVAPGATGWIRQTQGTTPVPGFNGGVLFCPPGGGTGMAFANYITGGTSSNDQWLITPQITNVGPNDSLKFWMRKFGNYLDHMDIKISTTTPNVAGMTTTVQLLTFAPADSGYIQYKYKIGALVPPGSNIYIGFRQWVLDANLDGASFSLDLVNVIADVTSVTQIGTEVPASFDLSQNYPNPFNPSTKINFSLPTSGKVKLAVYDMLGNEIAVLLDANESAGNYTASFDASKLSSGVYFYRLITSNNTITKKMMLVK